MSTPIEVTVFPRLECCVPDYTGKNRSLAGVLAEVKARYGDRVRIEVVPTGSRLERTSYYQRMLEALLAADHRASLPGGPEHLGLYQEAVRSAKTGQVPSPAAMPLIRQMSVHFFYTTPVIALDGKAAFVTAVPAVAELCQAIEMALAGRAAR